MSAIFPSAVATSLQLLTAVNNTKVTLTVAAGIGDTTLTVDDASPLPTSGYVTFDDDESNPETISYTGISGNNITGVTRAADGTAAGSHLVGANLEQRWNAAYHNMTTTEIIAVEQYLSDRFGIGSNIVVPSGKSFTLAKTSSQLIFGTTNTTTFSVTAPASSAVYTVPDVGTTANFVMSAGTQTVAGSKTFSSGVTISATTNQFVLGTTNTITITSPAPASSRTYTIPDAGGAASFVMTAGTQTIAGATTFSATLTMSGATIAMGSQKITGLAAATTAGDALRYEQLFTSGTVTFLGSIAFNPTTAGIVGTTTNNNTAAGNVGEYVSSIGSLSTFTSGNYTDLTSISLTAGDWDVSFAMFWEANGTWIWTDLASGVSITSGNSGTGLTTADNYTQSHNGGSSSTSDSIPQGIAAYRQSLSGTTTIYLKGKANFSTTAPIVLFRISARRVR